jgi:hypothetical protein
MQSKSLVDYINQNLRVKPMENSEELNLMALSKVEREEINGGIIPAIYGAILAHKAYVAMYGAAKVYGAYTGAAAATYVLID